jgi:hypothetical protein
VDTFGSDNKKTCHDNAIRSPGPCNRPAADPVTARSSNSDVSITGQAPTVSNKPTTEPFGSAKEAHDMKMRGMPRLTLVAFVLLGLAGIQQVFAFELTTEV